MMKKAVGWGALRAKLKAMNDEIEVVARPPREFHDFIGRKPSAGAA